MPAHAETVTISKGNKLKIDPNQQVMLDAAQKVMQKDYESALKLYNQVIAAAMAVRLSEARLQQHPQNARLYYQRGTGYRLLKDFPKATENIRYAMQLAGGKRDWEFDLKAIALEQKMNP